MMTLLLIIGVRIKGKLKLVGPYIVNYLCIIGFSISWMLYNSVLRNAERGIGFGQMGVLIVQLLIACAASFSEKLIDLRKWLKTKCKKCLKRKRINKK